MRIIRKNTAAAVACNQKHAKNSSLPAVNCEDFGLAGTFLAVLALTQLLVSLVVVMSVPAKSAALAAGPIYAGAGAALYAAASLISCSLFKKQRSVKKTSSQLRIAASIALTLIFGTLIWGYFSEIKFGPLILAAIIAVQSPLGLFIAKRHFLAKSHN
ncbi:hypothetical protein RQN30_09760 [Arcanobacterium hippocoleae]